MDASAVLSALVNAGAARQLLSEEAVCVPDVVDVEVVNALRRAVRAGRFDEDVAATALNTWRRLGVRRFPTHALVQRVWELGKRYEGYAGACVALAEALQCGLATADPKLGVAGGVTVTVVPN